MATMPGREAALRMSVESIVGQLDELHIQLNGMPAPSGIVDPRITWHSRDDLADTGKFAFADGHDGHYFALDDDIIYPPDYADEMSERLDADARRVLGWHGSVIAYDFIDYYEPGSRRLLRYFDEVARDTEVDILGTGTLAFVPTAVDFAFRATFRHRLVSDIEFAIAMRERGIPLLVVAHAGRRMLPVPAPSRGASISGSSRGTPGGPLDARALASELVRDYWR